MASARNAFRRKPGPTPGAPIKSPGGNPPDLTQFSETFEPSGGLFAPGYPLPPVEPERLRAYDHLRRGCVFCWKIYWCWTRNTMQRGVMK